MSKKKHHIVEKINENRRTALALGATGIGAFIFGKLFESGVLTGNPVLNRAEFKNFRFVETENEMRISDKSGNDIFIIDKESFTKGE